MNKYRNETINYEITKRYHRNAYVWKSKCEYIGRHEYINNSFCVHRTLNNKHDYKNILEINDKNYYPIFIEVNNSNVTNIDVCYSINLEIKNVQNNELLSPALFGLE
jgi:hypothetical protein